MRVSRFFIACFLVSIFSFYCTLHQLTTIKNMKQKDAIDRHTAADTDSTSMLKVLLKKTNNLPTMTRNKQVTKGSTNIDGDKNTDRNAPATLKVLPKTQNELPNTTPNNQVKEDRDTDTDSTSKLKVLSEKTNNLPTMTKNKQVTKGPTNIDGDKNTDRNAPATLKVLPKTQNELPNTTPNNQVKEAVSKRPLILQWIFPYHHYKWTLPDTPICGGGCTITRDRKLYNLSDAVIFYMQGTTPNDLPPPQSRRADQPFIWWDHESPWTVKHYWKKGLTEYDGYFNWTGHYRGDSYVTAALMPHSARDWFLDRVGRSSESSTTKPKPKITEAQFNNMFAELMKVKSKSAAWVVSDCAIVRGAIERRQFVDRLQSEANYHVDIYGDCGNLSIPKRNIPLFDVLRQYKFYIAFENTKFCKQYFTEKFWYNSLYAGVVPVVWGPRKETYLKLAPPGSFIHVDDFDGDVKKLANFLRMLDGDVDKYKEYFRWWTMPGFYPIYKLRYPEDERDIVSDSLFDSEINTFCHLCKLLHEGRHKTTTTIIPSLRDAFYGPEEDKCME